LPSSYGTHSCITLLKTKSNLKPADTNHTPLFLKTHFNIIRLFTPASSNHVLLFFSFPIPTAYVFSSPPCTYFVPNAEISPLSRVYITGFLNCVIVSILPLHHDSPLVQCTISLVCSLICLPSVQQKFYSPNSGKIFPLMPFSSLFNKRKNGTDMFYNCYSSRMSTDRQTDTIVCSY
jgi:hypothetical protein